MGHTWGKKFSNGASVGHLFMHELYRITYELFYNVMNKLKKTHALGRSLVNFILPAPRS